jgi:hypothetical protein
MIINVPFEFHRMEIPRRCRRPRAVRYVDTHTVDVREVTGIEAPVAIKITAPSYLKKYPRGGLKLRYYDGKLWTPYDTWRGAKVILPDIPHIKTDISDVRFYSVAWSYATEEDARKLLSDQYDKFLIVDGVVHRVSDEPRYVIHTTGLGHNHGVTGTSIRVEYGYNPNIHRDRYFRLDDRTRCIAAATDIAKHRGDTKSLPMRIVEKVEIMMYEAIKINPATEHGEGDPFINKIMGVVEVVEDPQVAGLLGTFLTAQMLAEFRA